MFPVSNRERAYYRATLKEVTLVGSGESVSAEVSDPINLLWPAGNDSDEEQEERNQGGTSATEHDPEDRGTETG
jgi:hypothetical protein